MTSALYTDTAALTKRAELNASKGRHDLEEWILQHVSVPRAGRVLDLGCGTGKQLFRLAPLVTSAGSLLGIDLSADAVRAVNDRARREGNANIEARRMALDDCVDSLKGQRFDLIVSSYAIYYSNDTVKLLRELRTLLKDSGTLFVCGTGQDTNCELIDVVNGFVAETTRKTPHTEDFLTPAEVNAASQGYSRSTVSRLDNEVAFDSAAGLFDWWTHHSSFVPTVAAQVRRHVDAHFAAHGVFTLTKNVLGVRLDA